MPPQLIYEYRRYTAAPGKRATLTAKFEKATLVYWKKHGIRCVGAWETVIGEISDIHYILAWADMEERERLWTGFMADPGWQAARAEYFPEEPLITEVHSELWRPIPGSPRATGMWPT